MKQTIKMDYTLGSSDLLPEGIFGLLGQPFTKKQESPIPERKEEKTKPKPNINKKVKPKPVIKEKKALKPRVKKHRVIPQLEIDYEKLNIPDSIRDLDTLNTVEVSEKMLRRISNITENRAKKLGSLLLCNTTPSILAHAASMNYVGAVMEDSFGIEFSEDQSIGEAIRDITKLEVLEFFVERLQIPEHRKELIMTNFVEKLTSKTVDRMDAILKSSVAESRPKSLEAVLVQKSKGREGIIMRSGQVPQDERVLQRPMIAVTPKSRR